MVVRRLPDDAPEVFTSAVSQLRALSIRPEVVLEEITGPARIAPFSAAWTGDLVAEGDELATGRFVLLHDPAAPSAWQGAFRVVTFVRATMDSEVGADPLLGQVGWSWLCDSLADCQAEHVAAGGTVTRVVSESYGSLANRPATVEIEVRASWTPVGAIEPHLLAWVALLATVGGLPPAPDVASLPRHRG